MMGFITHCCKSVLQLWAAKVHAWLGLGVLCGLMSFNAWAQTPALELAALYVDRADTSVVLSANLKLELGAAQRRRGAFCGRSDGLARPLVLV